MKFFSILFFVLFNCSLFLPCTLSFGCFTLKSKQPRLNVNDYENGCVVFTDDNGKHKLSLKNVRERTPNGATYTGFPVPYDGKLYEIKVAFDCIDDGEIANFVHNEYIAMEQLSNKTNNKLYKNGVLQPSYYSSKAKISKANNQNVQNTSKDEDCYVLAVPIMERWRERMENTDEISSLYIAQWLQRMVKIVEHHHKKILINNISSDTISIYKDPAGEEWLLLSNLTLATPLPTASVPSTDSVLDIYVEKPGNIPRGDLTTLPFSAYNCKRIRNRSGDLKMLFFEALKMIGPGPGDVIAKTQYQDRQAAFEYMKTEIPKRFRKDVNFLGYYRQLNMSKSIEIGDMFSKYWIMAERCDYKGIYETISYAIAKLEKLT